jgi:predicted nucleic acid-binding protein
LSTYVDTSTLLKLLIDEPGTAGATRIWNAAPALSSVTLVRVEARAGLAAAARSGRLRNAQHRHAKQQLTQLLDQLDEVEISVDLIRIAEDLAEQESLRGYDAVHLAAALLTGATLMTSADVRLLAAAARRGLEVADPTA